MAFTTSTVLTQTKGSQQFQDHFSEIWQVTATINPASVAAGAEDTGTLTVTDVALGDMILGYSPGVDLTVDAGVQVWVSAANTVTISLTNRHATIALDLATSTWKFLIGRPKF